MSGSARQRPNQLARNETGATLVREVCADLTPVPAPIRSLANSERANELTHRQWTDQIDALWQTEISQPQSSKKLGQTARLAFWNLERCRHVEASAKQLIAAKADIVLLCELDVGMARTMQRHTPRDLADQMQQGYAFGIEFVELGLGDPGECARHAGEKNNAGLHGNAILSSAPIKDPALIRSGNDGLWFDGHFGERRIGGRIAVAATIRVADQDVVFICTHFESRGDPQSRLREMDELLDAIDEYADDKPVIIAGDFNTNTTPRASLYDEMARAKLIRDDPNRFLDPIAHEPMFGAVLKRGYDWKNSNAFGSTQRNHIAPVIERHLDWFFTRGLEVSNPQIISATSANGQVLSDHDLILVTLCPENQT